MKKIVCFMLAVVMMFGMAGCEQKVARDARSLTLNGLIDKYKREDISVLLEDPATLFECLISTSDNFSVDDYSEWEHSVYHIGKMQKAYSKETVLCNLPANLYALTSWSDDSCIGSALFVDCESEQKSLDLAASLCEYMFAKYGDAASITSESTTLNIVSTEITEHDLRKTFFKKGSYTCVWSINGGFNVSVQHQGIFVDCVRITVEKM